MRLWWEQLSRYMYFAISEGTKKVYSIVYVEGTFWMSEGGKSLGFRDTLGDCMAVIEEWDTEPSEGEKW